MKGNIMKIQRKFRELPNVGMHNSVCLGPIDLGTHVDEKFGHVRRELMLTFELELRNSENRRFTVSKIYTQSTHKKSNLRNNLEGWLGKMSDKEANDMELESLLGEGAYLNLQLNDNGNIKIASISPLPPKIEKLKPENDMVCFSIGDWPKNEELFEGFSPFIKGKIQSSNEFKQITEATPEEAKPDPGPEDTNEETKPDIEEDVPF